MAAYITSEFKEKMMEALRLAEMVRKVDGEYYVPADELRIDMSSGEITMCAKGKEIATIKMSGRMRENDVITLTMDEPMLMPIRIEY